MQEWHTCTCTYARGLLTLLKHASGSEIINTNRNKRLHICYAYYENTAKYVRMNAKKLSYNYNQTIQSFTKNERNRVNIEFFFTNNVSNVLPISQITSNLRMKATQQKKGKGARIIGHLQIIRGKGNSFKTILYQTKRKGGNLRPMGNTKRQATTKNIRPVFQ